MKGRQKIALAVLVVLTALCLLASCVVTTHNSQFEQEQRLTTIAEQLEQNPQSAYQLLDSLDTRRYTDDNHHYYMLLRCRAAELSGKPITAYEDAVTQAVAYFTKREIADKAAFACFELARVYEAQDMPTKALFYYKKADEWAAKLGYQLAHFSYFRIPYNIASLLYDIREYREAIGYLNVALNSDGIAAIPKQYIHELQGLCHTELYSSDTASYHYGEAMALASQNNDQQGYRRIAYNRCLLYYKTKQYAQAEQCCSELLPLCIAQKDSLHAGLLYMEQARIHSHNGKVVQALSSMQHSEAFLSSIPNKAITLEVYDMLALLYAKAGNTRKANEYRQKHSELQAEVENQRATELEELQAELLRQQSESERKVLSLKGALRSEAQSKSSAISYLLALTASAALAAFTVVYRHGRGMYRELRVVCELELQQEVSKRNLINELLLETSGNPEANHAELYSKVEKVNSQFPAVLRYRYKELRRQLRNDYPSFSKDEHNVCWLLFINILSEYDAAMLMGFDADTFANIKASMMEKMEEAGNPFSKELRYEYEKLRS